MNKTSLSYMIYSLIAAMKRTLLAYEQGATVENLVANLTNFEPWIYPVSCLQLLYAVLLEVFYKVSPALIRCRSKIVPEHPVHPFPNGREPQAG
jgi:hypothetical protein